MRISDWSSDVCSSDLELLPAASRLASVVGRAPVTSSCSACSLVSYSSWIIGVSPTPGVVWVFVQFSQVRCSRSPNTRVAQSAAAWGEDQVWQVRRLPQRSEEHTSELQSLMSTSYAVFCLNTKTKYN